MSPRLAARAALLAVALAAPACSSADDGPSVASQSGDLTGDGAATCTATLRYLQKDAYKSTAGRSTKLWPPHTTTTLEIACDGAVVRTEVRENHGTKPGEKDANGDVILVEVGADTVSGPRARLDALADAYAGCECATKFLSMDALGDEAVQTLVARLADYAEQSLACTGDLDTKGVVALLRAGEVEAFLAALPSCAWADGEGWEEGLDGALEAVIAASQETLGGYHVCNNDAKLQAALVAAFAAGEAPAACDGDGAACHGPAWYFTPAK
jgi:hypothetical protein